VSDKESCRNCGNEECAADKCTIRGIRIMMECGKALDCIRPVRPTEHWQCRQRMEGNS